MNPDLILDRAEACRELGISRQTLITWIRRGKLKVWKRVGNGANAALLFERRHVQTIKTASQSVVTTGDRVQTHEPLSPDRDIHPGGGTAWT